MIQKQQLHWSHINTYLLCGYLYYLVYIKGLRRKGSSARYTGEAVHLAAGLNLKNKLKTGELFPQELISDIARDEVVRLWGSEEILLKRDEKPLGEKAVRDQTIDSAVALSQMHHTIIAPKIVPASVEEEWVLECPGFPCNLAGRRDVTEVDGTIRDLKTWKSKPKHIEQEHLYQLAMYALMDVALNKPLPLVAADYLVKTKQPQSVSHVTQLEWNTVEVVKSYVETVQEGIDRQVFLPAMPGNWIHSPEWCGFWDNCKYGGGGKTR